MPLIRHITGVADRLDVSEATARMVLSSQSATPLVASFARIGLALLAVNRGDIGAAEEQFTALEFLKGTTLVGAITVDRLLGLLCVAMGRLDQATIHFEEALAFCYKAGYRPDLARTCFDYADTLLQRDNPGDRDRARSLLEESQSISSELGMRPLMDSLHAIQERLQTQPASGRSYPDGLTEREVEVLRRIAAGRTDREIAAELFISSRTVNNHVRSILNKAAVANRTEAATYAAMHGLV